MAYKIKSEQSLKWLAEFYCSKRETSRAKLARYLERKCREQKIESDQYTSWIENVLKACEESRMVDDARYAEILIRDYTNRGKGKRYIQNKLTQNGVPKELREIPENEIEEFNRALALANKSIKNLQSKVSRKADRKLDQSKKSEKYAPKFNEKFELQQKLTQKLMSSGFSLEISRKATKLCLDNQ